MTPFPSAPLRTERTTFAVDGSPVVSDRSEAMASPLFHPRGKPRLPLSWMMSHTVSAFRISRTSFCIASKLPAPFRPVDGLSPSSMDGRDSTNYYGDSVTIGLASLRPSRVLLTWYVLAWVRCLIRLLSGFIIRR